MYRKKPEADICGNCGHTIAVLKVGNNTYGVKHVGNSYLCLETNCQCLDPTGRDTKLVGSRHPFNKIWNRDCLQGLVTI